MPLRAVVIDYPGAFDLVRARRGDQAGDIGDIFGDIFGGVADVATSVFDRAKGVIGDIPSALADVVTSVWDRMTALYGDIPEPIRLGVQSIVTSPLIPEEVAGDAILRIAHGQRVDLSVRDAFSMGGRELGRAAALYEAVAPYVQFVVSFVPGLGPGVSAAIGGAAALARGDTIDGILLSAVRGAVPGGPIVVAAFDMATRTVLGVAHGKDLDVAALSALRAEIPPEAQGAFDIGVSLAEGKRLQDVLVDQVKQMAPAITDAAAGAARRLLNSSDLAGLDAGSIATAMGVTTHDAQTAIDAARAILQTEAQIQGPIARAIAFVPRTSKVLAQTLLDKPGLRAMPATAVARELSVPFEVVANAMGSIASGTHILNERGMGAPVAQGDVAAMRSRVSGATSLDELMVNTVGAPAFARLEFRPVSTVGPSGAAQKSDALRDLANLYARPALAPSVEKVRIGPMYSWSLLGLPGLDVDGFTSGFEGFDQAGALSQSETKEAQSDLNLLGYGPLATDGMEGPKTDAAVTQLQYDEGDLGSSGRLDGATLARLRSRSAEGSSAPGTMTLPTTIVRAGTPARVPASTVVHVVADAPRPVTPAPQPPPHAAPVLVATIPPQPPAAAGVNPWLIGGGLAAAAGGLFLLLGGKKKKKAA